MTAYLHAQPVYIAVDSLQLTEFSSQGSNSVSLLSNQDSVGRRVVFWIHGLAGDLESWQRVQLVTENQSNGLIPGYPVRDVIGHTVDYSHWEETNPILEVGALLNTDMEIWRVSRPITDTLPVQSNFAIAHSQGGIVARCVRYQNVYDSILYPTQFSHIATFGTPHKGAYIINTTAKNQAMVIPWLLEGCRALAPTLINTFIGTAWYSDLIPASAIGSIARGSCGALNKTVLPLFVNSIRKPIAEDYAAGASKLEDTLQPFTLGDTLRTKGVNFYGVEQEPVLWRVLNSMTYVEDTTLGLPIILNNPFGLNDDQRMPDFINAKINDYKAKQAQQKSKALEAAKLVNFSVLLFPISVGVPLGMRRNHLQKALQYQNAWQWLSHANLNWKRYIGARTSTLVNNGYFCECITWGQSGQSYSFTVVQNPSDCYSSATSSYCQVFERKIQLIQEVENDGVVTVESQKGMPGVPSWRKAKMRNTNHMQERNCYETRDRLNELFDGQYGDEFKLDKK